MLREGSLCVGVRRKGIRTALAAVVLSSLAISAGTPKSVSAAVAGTSADARASGARSGYSTDRLRRQIMDAVAASRLGTASIGISVRDCDSNTEIISVQPSGAEKRLLIPASNLKLITSGVALMALGADYEFRTNIVLQGNRLIVRGCGDPAFADPALLDNLGVSTDQFVSTLATSVANAGAGCIDEIILDDRVFDKTGVHPDWPADQLTRAYCAPVCGINFHANVLSLYASPSSRVGEAPMVRTDPAAPWIEIDRQNARTVSQGNTELWIQPGASPTRFLLHGSVRSAITRPVQVTFKDPAMVFGRMLADGLMKKGVASRPGPDGRPTPPVVRYADPGENLSAPSGGERTVATVRTPISVVLERCNVESDNLYAEALLKSAGNKLTGQPGSWANGTAAARMMIKDRLGADAASTLRLADGSGLSRNNRVTASLMTRWLAEVASDSVGPAFIESLAMAGTEGTVKNRFKKSKLANEVRAKSGYIRQVRTLSGYVSDPASQRRYAFSVLINQVPPDGDQRAKDLHEKIVALIDDYLAAQTAGAGGGEEAVGG